MIRKYFKLLEAIGRKTRAKHADGIDETGGSRLRRLPPVWSIESACFARVFLWFQAVLSIYVSPLWISKSSSMIINISGVHLEVNSN